MSSARTAALGRFISSLIVPCAIALPMGVAVGAVDALFGRTLLPALLGALCASATSGALGLEKFAVAFSLPDAIDAALLASTLGLGAVFGLVGAAFAWLLARAKAWSASMFMSPFSRVAAMGSAVAVATLLLFGGRYAGLGTNLISAGVAGGVLPLDWLAKLLLAVATLAAGYQGGEVTPLFSIGASLGCVLAVPFGIDAALAAALGYAAVFGGATNALLAPALVGAEVFGYEALRLFSIACAVACAVNFNQTIYSGQQR